MFWLEVPGIKGSQGETDGVSSGNSIPFSTADLRISFSLNALVECWKLYVINAENQPQAPLLYLLAQFTHCFCSLLKSKTSLTIRNKTPQQETAQPSSTLLRGSVGQKQGTTTLHIMWHRYEVQMHASKPLGRSSGHATVESAASWNMLTSFRSMVLCSVLYKLPVCLPRALGRLTARLPVNTADYANAL